MTAESNIRQQREEDQEWDVVEFRSPGPDNHIIPNTTPDYSAVSLEDSDDDLVSEEVQNIMGSSRNGSACSTKVNDNGPPLSLSDISVHIIEDDVRKQSEDQLLKVVMDFPTTPRCSPSDTSIHKTDDSNDRQQSEDQLWNVVEFRSPGPDNHVIPKTIPDYSVVLMEDSDDDSVSEEVHNIMGSSRNGPHCSTRLNDNANIPPLSLSDISVHILEDDVRKQSEDQLLKVGEDLPTTPRYSPTSPALSDQGDSLIISTTSPQELAAEAERNADTRLWESGKNLNNRYLWITVCFIDNEFNNDIKVVFMIVIVILKNDDKNNKNLTTL